MDEVQDRENQISDETLYYLKPEERVGLTNCDREPIHLINHVQPHAALFALNPGDLTIVQASENTRSFFGLAAEGLLGQKADRLFGADKAVELQASAAQGRLDANPLYVFRTPVAGQGLFNIIAHVYQGVLIVEAEPVGPEDSPPDYYALNKQTLTRFEKAPGVREFAQTVCEEVRGVSGFDRVMVYKFLEDYSGQVIAEDLAPEQGHHEAYLGLRYPASDIPKQARALFLLNKIRMMPDARYAPSALIPAVNPLTDRPLDMSYAFSRGVSQMYSEYLLNMGVVASLTLALFKDGELWGLIACHHYTPRRVAHEVRAACEFLAHVVSLQITEKEANEESGYRGRIEEMHHGLIEHMAGPSGLRHALTNREPDISAFLDCGGSAVLLDGKCRLFGTTPDERQVRALTDWLADMHPEEVYATSSLPAEYMEASAFKAAASGVLACRVAREPVGYILWFRPEVVQTVDWAGDPAKPYETGPMGDRLTPRKSFALWRETVRDTALAWKPLEIAAVRRLRVTVIEVHLAEELAHANAKLAKSNVELDDFAYIASHDLKEPLRGIHNFTRFLKEDYGNLLPDTGQENLETVLKLTRRMEALIESLFRYARVGRLELAYQESDLNPLVKEALEGLHVRIEESRAEIRIRAQQAQRLFE